MAVPDEVRLSIYNRALIAVGDRELGSLEENREPRHVMDRIWASKPHGALRSMLEMGFWRFCIRTVSMLPDTAQGEAEFGLRNIFRLPDDYIEKYQISESEYFEPPLSEYQQEGRVILSEATEIYMRYTSETLGADSAAWPASFQNLLIAYMAKEYGARPKGRVKQGDLNFYFNERLKEARSADVMEGPSRRVSRSSWETARIDRSGFYRDQRR